MPQLEFRLTLTDVQYRELKKVCRNCECSPARFAREALEVALASRLVPSEKRVVVSGRVR